MFHVEHIAFKKMSNERKNLSVKLNEFERKALEDLAKEKNMTLGEYIRYMIIKEYDKKRT